MNKRFLLATTALCAITIFAANRAHAEVNVESVEGVDILSILNNSAYKSPDITWSTGTEGGERTHKIMEDYYQYTIADPATRTEYTTRQTSLSGDVTADFLEIGYNAGSSNAWGGAIYNNSTITTMTGDFIGNYAQSSSRDTDGGAIYNNSKITTLTGDFIGNYALATGSTSGVYGGAIYNSATITTMTGDFIGNYASGHSASGGAISNNKYGTISTLTGDFIGNYASGNSANGGAIINFGTITTLTGDSIGNYVSVTSKSYYALGGAIANNSGTITTLTGDFIGNYASGSSNAWGGAIYNSATITTLTGDFIGNYAKGSTDVKGGAIANGKTITFVADAEDSEDEWQDDILFQGNYVEDRNGKRYEAIYNSGSSATMTFKSRNNGSYTFYDYINGDNTAKVNFTAENGTGTLNLYQYGAIKGQKEVAFSGDWKINTVNGVAESTEIQNLNITDGKTIGISVDGDLINGAADSISVTNHASNTGSLVINSVKLSDSGYIKQDSVTLALGSENVGVADDIMDHIEGSHYYTSVEYDETSHELVFSDRLMNQSSVEEMLQDYVSADDLADYAKTADVNTALAGKADKSTVDTLSDTVANKADKSTVDTLSQTVSGLSTTVGTLSTDVGTLKNDVSGLKTDVSNLGGRVDTLEGTVTALSTTVDGKADKTVVEALTATVNNKADKSTVDALSQTVATKADKSTVDALSQTVATKADKSTVDALSQTVATKADKSALEATNNAVTAAVARIAANEGAITTINGKITTIEGNVSTLSDTVDTLSDTVADLSTDFGDVADFKNSTTGNIKNADPSSTTLNAQTVTKAIANIDASIGQVHGLADKLKKAGKYKGNLAEGTTVEEHLAVIDTVIGDRSQFATGRYTASSAYVADAVMALDNGLSNLADDFVAAQGANEARFRNLDRRINKLDDKISKGIAGSNALAALKPLDSSYRSQLAVALGGFDGDQAVAFGAFHYINNRTMINAGISYSGRNYNSYNVGIVFGF